VLCTGRSPQSTLPYLDELGLDGVVITHNGAATVASTGRRTVHRFEILPQQLEPYIQFCHKHTIHFDINTVFELYVDDRAGVMPDMLNLYAQFLIEPKQFPSWDALEDAPVKMTLSGQPEAMDRVEAEFALWEHRLHYIRSSDYFIDIMHQDATKGSALAKLAELRGIAPEQVLAIGNYYNDLSMLQFAGMGIAMNNAPIEVKAAAREVTNSNNEDGVHDALVKHCLKAGVR
jgi:Cof subfamily protein (haloacid dehalogenase superfamily)